MKKRIITILILTFVFLFSNGTRIYAEDLPPSQPGEIIEADERDEPEEILEQIDEPPSADPPDLSPGEIEIPPEAIEAPPAEIPPPALSADPTDLPPDETEIVPEATEDPPAEILPTPQPADPTDLPPGGTEIPPEVIEDPPAEIPPPPLSADPTDLPPDETEIVPEATEDPPEDILPTPLPSDPTVLPPGGTEIAPEASEVPPEDILPTPQPADPTDLPPDGTEIPPEATEVPPEDILPTPLPAEEDGGDPATEPAAEPTPEQELPPVDPSAITPNSSEDVLTTTDPDATVFPETPELTEDEIANEEDPAGSGLDPWFYINGTLISFRTDCTGIANCISSTTPFQAAIDHLKDNKLDLNSQLFNWIIYVESGTINENLTFDDFNATDFQNKLVFTGGCDSSDFSCSSPTSTTLTGLLNFKNSNANIQFMNFVFLGQINLENSTNITLNQTFSSAQPIKIHDVSGNNSITIEDNTGDDNDTVEVKTTYTGGYDQASTIAEPIKAFVSNEIRTTFSQDADSSRSLTVHVNKVARLNLSAVTVKDFSYSFNHIGESYSLQQSDNNTMSLVSVEYGLVRFSNPTRSLTIKTTAMDSDFTVMSFNNDTFAGSLSILGESPRDDILIETDLLLKGKDLHIRGGKVTIAAGKILSTRAINTSVSNPNYETNPSTGDSGDIRIEASDFDMKAGSKLLAHADSGFEGGSATINAEDTNGWGVPAIDWLREKLGILIGSAQGVYVNGASVKLDSAVIRGDSVSITARSGYSISAELAEDIAQALNGTAIGEFLSSLTGKTAEQLGEMIGDLGILNSGLLPIPVGINVRVASSDINLLGSTLISALNNISILSTAVSNSDLTVSSKFFSIGISVAVTNSVVNIAGTSQILSTDGDILMNSEAQGNASVTTGTTTKAELNKLPLSFAVGVSVLNSKAETGAGTLVDAGGSVNLIANGTNIGGGNATVFLVGGGANAITLGVYTGVSNVLAKADGTIIAKSSATHHSLTPINLANVNESSNTITIPGHGFTNGQKVVYRAANYQLPIPGLIDGEIYTIYVVDVNNVRFVSASPVDISSTGVTPDSSHSFVQYVPVVFSSASLNDSIFTIEDHGFIGGQVIRYSSLLENPIGGLIEGTEYFVKWLDKDRFQLLEKTSSEPISLTLPEGAPTSHSFWYLDETNKKSFIPVPSGSSNVNVDDTNDVITMPGHGYQTGDMIYYRVPDGKIVRKITLSYNFVADSIVEGTNTLMLLYADTENLEVDDVVKYRAWDNTQIGNLVDGTEYKIKSITPCNDIDPDDPDNTCYLITLKTLDTLEEITFSKITPDPKNTGINPYTPLHSLTKIMEYDGADNPIYGLKEGISYFVAKIDDDSFKLANSIDEANEIAIDEVNKIVNGVDLGIPTNTSVTGHVFDSGETNGIGIRANLSVSESSSAGSWYNQDRTATSMLVATVKTKVINTAQAGGSKIYNLIKKALGLIDNKAPETKDDTTEKSKNKISTAGGLAVSVGVNSVKAEVGSNAELYSAQDIEVQSMLRHQYASLVEAEASPSAEQGSAASLGIAISATVIVDSNKAIIDNGAVLNAKRDLNIDAATTYPSLARATLLQIQQAGIGDIAGVIWSSSQSTSFVFASNFFNGFVRSTAAGNQSSEDPTKIGIAGSMGFVYLDSTTLARIGDNVRINQDAAYHTVSQSVQVSSTATASLVHMAGNFAFNYQPGLESGKKLESVKKYFKNLPGSAFTPFGSSGSKSGVGGSVYVPILIFDNSAEIGDGVRIRIGKDGKLTVVADTQVDNFCFVQAGSQADEGFAVAGAISYIGIFNTTIARIAPTAKIVGGSVSVKANDITNNYNLLGSLAFGTNVGVGVSIGVNTILRDVYAVIGNFEGGQSGPWQVDFTNSSDAKPITMTIVPHFDGNGNLSVETNGAADTKEVQIIVYDLETDESFTLTFGDQTTAAIAKNASASDIQAALNGLSSISTVGGVTVIDGENGGWEVTFNTIGFKGLITSNIADSSIIEEGAVNTNERQLLDMGGATQGGYRLSFNGETTDVLPWNANAAAIAVALNKLTSVKSLKADNSGTVTVTEGSADGKFIITFSVFEDLDFIMFQPLEFYDGSYHIDQIQAGNDQSQAIFSNAHSGGFTLTYNGQTTGILPYNATPEQIQAALNALVEGGVKVKGLSFTGTDGTINIPGELMISANASGDNWVFAVAAAATKDSKPKPSQGTTNGNGMPRKTWQKTILVDLKLAGQNFPQGGSGSMNQNQKTVKNAFAVAGAIPVNIQIDKVYAILRDSGLVTASKINLSATNDTVLRVAAGSAALATNGTSTSAGIAGAVTFNWVDGITSAIIENVKIGSSAENPTTKPTEVSVEAKRSGDVFALAAGAAGALKEKGIAVTGSIAINILKNVTEAKVFGLHSESEIAGNLKIHAKDESEILGNAGALSYGGKAGVGAAFALNLILNKTNAFFDNSNLIFSGNLDLTAEAVNLIIAGAGSLGVSKGDAGVGGTVAINILLNTVQAQITGSNAVSTAKPSSVTVKAENESTIYSVAGAVGAAKKAGVGIAIAFNFIQPSVKAVISDSKLSIGDIHNASTADVSALTVSAKDTSEIYSISAGGAGSEKIAVAGGISVNIILSEVQAYISGTTTVIQATGDITVSAQGMNKIYALSGNVAGAGKVAVGAALSYNHVESDVHAYIDAATVESTNGNVFIDAQSAGTMVAISAGGAFAGKVAVDGSVVIGVLKNEIWAYADQGAKITAAGSVGISAADTISAVLVAGVVGGAGTVAVGVSNSTFVSNNEVLAYTGSNVVVKGKGKKAVVKTLGTDLVNPGSWKEVNQRGVFVNAISNHEVRIFAVGGMGAGTVSVAASGTVSVINDKVIASIGETSTVEASNDDSEDDLSKPYNATTNPFNPTSPLTVSVLAGGKTTMWGVAGALSGAGTVGVGAGLDVGVLTKTVEASIQGEVISKGDILVQALSHEQIISVSASIGGGGTVGVAGSVGTYVLNLDTLAWVGSKANLSAQGSVLVSAYDATHVVLTAGSISGAGTVGVGASIEVSVTNKNVNAYIDENAVVDARGNGNGLVAFSGSYSETYVENDTPPDVDNNVEIKRHTFALSDVNNNEDTIDLGANYGYKTGQALVYSPGKVENGELNDAIGGLEDGQTYYVIVDPLNPNIIRLATDYLNAKNGIAIALNPLVGSGTGHSLWNGQIDGFDAKFKLPGLSYEDDLNGDDEKDADPNQDSLTKKRTTTPNQLPFKGIAVAAVNQDSLLTFVVSGGGAGTVAVNVSGLVNVINVTVDAHIGENAKINQTAGLVLSSGNSVYVLAGNDFFHIGVVPAANGAGTVSVVPAADVMVMTNNVVAIIADGAQVKAKQNVVLDAQSHEQIISVVAGVTGSGMVSVGASVAVVVIDNTTIAAIGDEDNDTTGATIYTDGNVLVNAYDRTHVILVAGNLAIGGGAVGVGASISVMTVDKFTSAFISPYSIVNAKGNGSAILEKAYQKSMTDVGAFSTFAAARGVIVQAYSDDKVITVVGAGAGGLYAGVAGAVLVNVYQTDTSAYIGAHSLVNQDRANVNNSQDVLVTALNHSKVFNFAGSVGGGIAGVAGAVEVNVVRNNAKAYIGSYANVTARRNVQVAALSNEENTSVAATIGAGAVGASLNILVNVFGSEFTTRYQASYSETERDEDGNLKSDKHEQTVDEDPLTDEDESGLDRINNEIIGASGQKDKLSDALGKYDSTNKSGNANTDYTFLSGTNMNNISTVLKNKDIQSSILDALKAQGDAARSGTVAYIGNEAAILAETGNIDIIAQQRIKFLAIGGSLAAGGGSLGAVVEITVTGSNVEAYVQSGAELTAGSDINILSSLISDMQSHAVAGNFSGLVSIGAQVTVVYDHATQRAAIGDSESSSISTIVKAKNLTVSASSNRKILADASGAAVGGGAAVGASIAVSVVDGQTLAFVGGTKFESTDSSGMMTVKAFSLLDSETWTINLSGGAGISLGAAIAVNKVNPTTEATVWNSVIGLSTKVLDTLEISAISQVKVDVKVNGVNVGAVAAGLNVGVAHVNPVIIAQLNSSDLYGKNLTIKTYYNYSEAGSKLDQGANVLAAGGSAGGVGVQGTIATVHSAVKSTNQMKNVRINPATTVVMISRVNNKMEAKAIGAAGGAIAVTVNLSVAENKGSEYIVKTDGLIYFEVPVSESELVPFTMDNLVAERAYAETISATVGLIGAGGLNISVAILNPVVRSTLINSNLYTSKGSITSQYDGDASAKSVGVTVALPVIPGGSYALGISVSVSTSTPTIEASVSGLLNSGLRDFAGGELIVEARQNLTADGTKVESGATAEASSSGGALFSGTGAIAVANNKPILKASVTDSSGIKFKTVSINALSYNKSYAKTFGINIGGIAGVGASVSRATSDGSAEAWLDSTIRIKTVENLRILAQANDNAYAESKSGAGGIISGSGSSAKSYAEMTVKAEIRGNRTVNVVNDINISAIAAPKSTALAKGVNVAGLAVGASEAWATTGSEVTASVSGTITTINLSILAQKTQQGTDDNSNATAWASSGSLIGINATVSKAFDYSEVRALVSTNSKLIIDGLLTLSAVNSGKQTATGNNEVVIGLILAVGGSSAEATSNTITEARFSDTVTVQGGGTIEISAYASDDNTAVASAGGGGAIAGSSTHSKAISNGTTTAGLGAGNIIDSVNFSVEATHVAKGSSDVDALTIGVISGSGVYTTNNVDSTVTANIGAGSKITANLISIKTLNKTDLTNEQSGTTGGIISAAGASSLSDIKLTTRIDIGAAVHLVTNNYDKALLQMQLAAENIVNADSQVTFTTGGALAGAHGSNIIRVKTLLAEVLIGAGSQLISNGAMDISARGSGKLNGETDLDTYGIGTVMTGGTLVEVYPVNQIIIRGGGTMLQAQNDLSLATGRSSDTGLVKVADNYYANARLDGFAGSAFPIDGTSAEAYVIQTNLVQIDSGSTVRSGNQLNLYAEWNDLVDLLARAKVVSWVSKAADGLSNLFSDNSTELFTGDSLAEAHAKVIMNGTAETGFNRDQRITFDNLTIQLHVDEVSGEVDPDKTYYSVDTPVNIGNIPYVLGIATANSPLLEALNNAQKMLADFGNTNPTLKTFYENEIKRIQDQLASLYPGVGNSENPLVGATSEVITITIAQIIAAAGRIDIRTGILEGNGNFIAPGNSKVEIINNTQAFLNLFGVLIPDDNGGVYLNTVRLGTDNSVITDSNALEVERLNRFNHSDVDPQAAAGTAAFTLPQPPDESDLPSVRIENTLNIANFIPNVVNQHGLPLPDDQLNKFKQTIVWPDITLLSSLNYGSGIINSTGSVEIFTLASGKSTVRILNTIRSIEQNIISGGNVYVEGLTSYSVGGETAAILNGSSGYYTVSICGTFPRLYFCTAWHTVGSGLGSISPDYYNSYVNGTSGSTLMGDRITIKAEYININGIIQSGRDNYTLNLSTFAWNEAQMATIYKMGRVFLPMTSAANPGFSVYYNTVTEQFETDPITSSGGYVELVGKVLSTGQGQIKVLSGYPTVQITNSTNVSVLVGKIDLSQEGAGALIIIDNAGGRPDMASSEIASGMDNKTYTSTFTHNDGQIQVNTTGSANTSKTAIVTGASIQYKPDSSWYYGWTTVQSTISTRYAYIKEGKWLDFIPDVFQVDEDDWGSWSASTPTYGGNGPYYFMDDSSSRPDLYNSSNSISTYDSGQLLIWSNTYWTWYGSKVYEATYKQVKGSFDTYTHEVNAHRPISISFIGSASGSISINATGNGDVILDGALLNPSGSVTVNVEENGIYSIDESGSIVAQNITLSAGSNIGTANTPLPLQLVGNTGMLQATALKGSIFLKHLSEDLRIDTISAPVGDVSIISAGSILAAAGKSGLITGNNITLDAGKGIGASTASPLQINSNMSAWNGKVNVSAIENIYLREISGNLNLEKMITNGDVWLQVVSGNLVDANKLQTRDERTYQELLNTVYARLQLLNETGAQAKIDNLYKSLAAMKTQEYQTYWQYRLMQEEPSDYDNTFIVGLTDAERIWYSDFYAQQGAENGLSGDELAAFVNNALQTLVNARTDQYRTLHTNYGSLGNSYDPDYQYSLSQSEKDELKAGIKVWTKDELLQLISGNLLKPVSSTMTDIEDPNIVARNITLDVSGTIGIYNLTPVILPVVDGKLDSLNDDQKVALAAAERSDVVFVGTKVTSTIVPLQNNQIILRAPTGTSWQELGFTTNGMAVQLMNIYLNVLVASEQEAWTIESINGSIMTLSIQKTIPTNIQTFLTYNASTVVTGIITDPEYYLSDQNPDRQYAVISALHIYSRDDINVDSNGIINAIAGKNIYLGGGMDTQGDLNLGVIQSLNGGEIRIRSRRNITNSAVSPQATANVITNGDVVLEAGGGSVGESTRPIYTTIGGNGLLTARADKNVYISQILLASGNPVTNPAHPYLPAGNAPDLKISSIYAQTGEIVIKAAGSILDGENTNFTKLLAKHITLVAGDAIGSLSDPLEVRTYFSADQPGNGWLKAAALNNIYLSDPEGDMGVLNIFSYEGDVDLSALNSILDAGDLTDPYNPASDPETDSVGGRWPKANIIGNNITLKVVLGGIGAANNELDIDSRYKNGNGKLTASSGNLLNTYLIETDGDIALNTVITGKDVVTYISAPSGSILNGAAVGVANIQSGKTKLFAANHIGAADNRLTSEVGALEGTATTGSVWIHNEGALILGGVSDDSKSVVAGGNINISAGSPITVIADTIADIAIELWAKDGAGTGDDLTVHSNVTIWSKTSHVLLSAGDNLIINAGAIIRAVTDIILRADSNTINGDGTFNLSLDALTTEVDLGSGAIVTIHGDVEFITESGGLYLQTYGDNDIINLHSIFPGNISTGAGDDQFRFFGNAALTNDGSIDGGSGFDTLDYAGYDRGINVLLISAGTIDGFRGNELSISGGFDNIDNFNGSAFSDKLTGTNQNSVWTIKTDGTVTYGSSGKTVTLKGFDELIGGSADDFYVIDNGASFAGILNGGAGINWFDFSAYTTPLDINLTTMSVPGIVPGNYSNIPNIIGGSANDVLTGDARDNRLYGGPGDDILYGMDGNDILNGGEGIDELYGGKGNDTFIYIGSEQMNDLIDGGPGLNTLDFSASSAAVSVVLGGTGDLTGMSGSLVGQSGSFTNIGDLVGSSFEDFLFGLDAPSAWEIGLGTNRYIALSRSLNFRDIENLMGGIKADTFRFLDDSVFQGNIDGGINENNRLDFSPYTTPVYVDLSTDTYSAIIGIVTNVLWITGGSANDTLIGNDLPNVIDGGPGDDLIRGLGGNDILFTGGGNNIVYGDDGNDYIFSGTGFNTLYGGDGYDVADIAWPGGFRIPLGDIELVITHNPEETLKQRQILVIDVVNLQSADISDEAYYAFLVRLETLDQVLVLSGTAQKIILNSEEDSGEKMPAGVTVSKVMVVQMLRNGIQIRVTSSQFLISFVLPAGANPSLYSILFWDEGSGTWIEIPMAYVIDSTNGGIGRLEAWVNRTGKYVLVFRGI